MMKLFEKKPGERMPNLLGWIVILTTDLVVALIVLAVYMTCQGCATTSTVTRRGPEGITTTTSHSYAAGLVSSYTEDSSSQEAYDACLSMREHFLEIYRSGRVLNWAEMSDQQQTCFQQTSGFDQTGWNTSGFPGTEYGYGWTSPPTLNPYVRSAQ